MSDDNAGNQDAGNGTDESNDPAQRHRRPHGDYRTGCTFIMPDGNECGEPEATSDPVTHERLCARHLSMHNEQGRFRRMMDE
ncbi:MAG: hypothetical protein M3347_06725 [Armatimonadota bacterium]|nr:hypothetical protein [Armatimonadota bacterium]